MAAPQAISEMAPKTAGSDAASGPGPGGAHEINEVVTAIKAERPQTHQANPITPIKLILRSVGVPISNQIYSKTGLPVDPASLISSFFFCPLSSFFRGNIPL